MPHNTNLDSTSPDTHMPSAAVFLGANSQMKKSNNTPEAGKTKKSLAGSEASRKTAHSLQHDISEATNAHKRRHHPGPHHSHYQRLSNPYSSSSAGSSSSKSAIISRSPMRTSERYMNSNYRFLVRHPSQPTTASSPTHSQLSVSSGERSIEWDQVECVIIPTTEEARCPICLDTPTAPRVTQCGHFFCWTCLLRYLLVTVPDVPSGQSKNWRCCPVCADQFHQKKIKPVHFYEAVHAQVGVKCEFVLLRRRPSDDLLSAECLSRDLAMVRPSPFSKVTELSDGDILETILIPERSAIISRMKEIDASDLAADGERHFLEQALSLLNDQMQLFASSSPQPTAQKPTDHSKKQEYVYFHQSADGQYMFLDSLSIKILKTMYGSYERFPTRLSVTVNEVEDMGMGKETAKRFKHLSGYVPHGAAFTLCEVDLAGVVSDSVLAQFGKEISIRQQARDQRSRREDFESRSAARRSSLDDGFGYYYNSASDDIDITATSLKDDIINFPPPPGADIDAPVRPAVWYTKEPTVIRPDTPNSGLLFNLSLDDLQQSSDSTISTSPTNPKKGRKFILIGGNNHRR